MRKQIYVKEEDEETFERAQELSGPDSLSATIAEALGDYIDHKLKLEQGYKRIILEIPEWNSEGERVGEKKVYFYGRTLAEKFIFNDKIPEESIPEEQDLRSMEPSSQIAIFQGKKGKFLLLWKIIGKYAGMVTAESLEELKDQEEFEVPDSFVEQAEENLKQKEVETEVLDL